MHPLRIVLSIVLAIGVSAWPLAARASADAVSAVQMLSLLNQLRYAIGAPTITADPRVVLAAQRHADYSTLNGAGGHYETPGLPGFSGVLAQDRVAAAGWSTSFVSEVATGHSGALEAVTELWHAPYHRLGMMHPNTSVTGWGHSDLNGRSATVGNFVKNFGLRAVDFVRSPAHGQAGIPTSWSGRESPSPLPAGVSGPVGYPIMVVYAAGQRVDLRGAEIVAPGGARVAFYEAPQQFEFDYRVIIPRQPLAAGTTYHVRFDLTVNGRYVTNEWDFTTAGSGGSKPAPAPTLADGYHSSWVSQSPYPTLAAGELTAPLTISFRNTGTRSWVRGTLGRQANLGINGDDRSWAELGVGWPTPDRVAIQNEASVAPGAVGSFTFRMRAPAAPGLWAIHLRPVIDGTTWMEDQGVFLYVTVR